jgi:hypothetical protein
VPGKGRVINERADGRDDEDANHEATPVAAEPADDPWDGFPLDESVFRSG